MTDRAEVIRLVAEKLLAKRREQHQDGDAGIDEGALLASIEEALQEIFAEFDGDLSEVPEEDLAQLIDEYVGRAIDDVA